MISGRNDTPGSNLNASPAVSAGPRGPYGPIFPVNISFIVLVVITGQPSPAPRMMVPPGATVTLEAQNGKSTGNSALVYVGRTRSSVANGRGTVLSPDSEKSWPCYPNIELWVNGIAGDGVIVKIQRGV